MTKPRLLKDHVQQLKDSKAAVGALIPILVNKDGTIIDGRHRAASSKSWPSITLNLTPRQALVARLSVNALRKPLDELDFDELGALLVSEGVKRGNVAHEIAKLTGVSYNVVLNNIDQGLKKQTHHQYSKEDKEAFGKRMSAVAANKRTKAEAESVADIESVTDSAETDSVRRVDEAVKRYENETAQAYSNLSTKNERTPYHSFVTQLSALCDAVTWVASMPAGEITNSYMGLNSKEITAVNAKVKYIQENVEKLAASCRIK